MTNEQKIRLFTENGWYNYYKFHLGLLYRIFTFPPSNSNEYLFRMASLDTTVTQKELYMASSDKPLPSQHTEVAPWVISIKYGDGEWGKIIS
tara:strand:- start:167 stop:442 length:276 start_codon:yes stop_codon:yes gene_type:complete